MFFNYAATRLIHTGSNFPGVACDFYPSNQAGGEQPKWEQWKGRTSSIAVLTRTKHGWVAVVHFSFLNTYPEDENVHWHLWIVYDWLRVARRMGDRRHNLFPILPHIIFGMHNFFNNETIVSREEETQWVSEWLPRRMDEELMRLSMTMHLIPNEWAPPKTETTTIRICEIVYGRDAYCTSCSGLCNDTGVRAIPVNDADALEIWSEHQRSLIRYSRGIRYVRWGR